jgi:hypothetical protein
MVTEIKSRSGEALSANINALIWFLSPNAKVLQIESWKTSIADMDLFPSGMIRTNSLIEDPVRRSGKNSSVLKWAPSSFKAVPTLKKGRMLAMCLMKGGCTVKGCIVSKVVSCCKVKRCKAKINLFLRRSSISSEADALSRLKRNCIVKQVRDVFQVKDSSPQVLTIC